MTFIVALVLLVSSGIGDPETLSLAPLNGWALALIASFGYDLFNLQITLD